jgi:hypothetical protein
VDSGVLWAVSCPSDSFCVAVDGTGDVVLSTDPTGGGSAWSVVNVDGGTKLTSVSCASESLCVAVDAAGNALSSTDPLGGAGAWNVVPADPGHAFTSVSCTPAGLCVAVDNAGHAVTSTFSPQTEGGQSSGESSGSQTAGPTTSMGSSPLPPQSVVSRALRILSVKVGSDGQIVLTLEVPADGPGNAVATALIREATVGPSKQSRCKTRCVRRLAYGRASDTARGANALTITIEPTKSALKTLKALHLLRVPITVVFRPRDGSPTSVSEIVTVRYRQAHGQSRRD